MFKKILPGILFTMLWSTGSISAKFGLHSADALLLASFRFIGTGVIFGPCLLIKYGRGFWPEKNEWKPILIYGFLNTTLTLGAFFQSQKYASAGISTLFIASGPLIMMLFSSIFLRRPISRFEITGMVTAFCGIVICAAAELPNGHVTPLGLLLLTIYITAYTFSSIYFSRVKISMSNAVFNVWQVFTGGLLLLPFLFVFKVKLSVKTDMNLFFSLTWMILVLSFIANQLWLYLLKIDPVKAAAWLYLTPVFGYLLGYLFFGETITLFVAGGTILVIIGLVLAGIKKRSGSMEQ